MAAADIFWVWGIGLAGFLLLWPISLWRRDASIVDFWWGPGFGAMALAAWLWAGSPTGGYTLILLGLVAIWSGRLGLHLGWRRLTEGAEDPRYAEMRAAREPGWWWKSLFMVFVLQGVVQGVIAAGLLVAIARGGQMPLDAAGMALGILALCAICVQGVSDWQLDAHRSASHGAAEGGHTLLTTGLRGIVRHPSYSAEIVFWWSLSLLALRAGVIWAPLSAVIVTLLLRYVSGVTIIDERMQRTRPDFAAYRDRVPALVPRLASLRRATRSGRSRTPG